MNKRRIALILLTLAALGPAEVVPVFLAPLGHSGSVA